jgi:uncharacterized membrane protein
MERSLNVRFWEVDSLRGLAIIMMVTYHFIFDLTFFGIPSIYIPGFGGFLLA